jgi:alpha-L-fucosidase
VAFVKAQVRELCTQYGEIHGLWWDMNVPQHRDPTINEMIRQLQPKAVINNRGFDAGDFGTPERDYEADAARAFSARTEACQSVGMESWGYREDEDYYTDRHLERSIDRYLARDANFLLNVGPTADGTIPERSASILRRIGQWYRSVEPSLVAAEPASHLTRNTAVMLTKRERTLFVHLNQDPRGDAVKLPPWNVLPHRAVLLNDGRPVRCVVDVAPSDHQTQRAYLRVTGLPVDELSNTVLVVALEFDRPVDEITPSLDRG